MSLPLAGRASASEGLVYRSGLVVVASYSGNLGSLVGC